MSKQPCLLEISTYGIATLTLNRPKVNNALDEATVNLLIDYLYELEGNPSVRIVVLKSIGKVFCAGADLNWVSSNEMSATTSTDTMSLKLAQLMQVLHNHIKPTIILITGATYGGGIGLVACCDIAIATQNAIFCFSEVRLGLVPAIISPYIVKALGKRIALRYFLTAENFDAQEAWRIGLVHHVISENKLGDDLNKITDALLAASPNALAKTKKLVTEVSTRPLDDTLIRRTSQLITEIRNTSEAKEGISAFLQKRKASWVKKSP